MAPLHRCSAVTWIFITAAPSSASVLSSFRRAAFKIGKLFLLFHLTPFSAQSKTACNNLPEAMKSTTLLYMQWIASALFLLFPLTLHF